MQISRLHVMLVLIAIGVAGYVAYEQKMIPGLTEKAAPQGFIAQPEAPAVTPVAAPAAPVRKPSAPAPAAPAVSSAIDRYTTSKGDTLWAIARDHSPAQAGPAWVGIWKANKKIIKDFDRLEAGLNLFIPQERGAYVTAFWRPKRFETAQQRRDVDLAEVFRVVPAVDVAELPIPWADQEVNVAELPLPESSPEYEFAVTALRAPVPPLIPYR